MKRPLFARIEYKYVKSLFIPLPDIGRGILKSEGRIEHYSTIQVLSYFCF